MTGRAADLNVPGTYSTIAAAVAAAAPNDTILVAAGTYSEGNIGLNKPLFIYGAQWNVDARLRGTNGTAATETVLTGTGLIFALASPNITMAGFKFANMGLRCIEPFTSVDYLTMSNNVFMTTQNGNCDGGGNIQFTGGGSPPLTAHHFVFEQNHVYENTPNECGYFLYCGAVMDSGTVRNNYIQTYEFSFGPFGQRTGWLIEGNEFDGNLVVGTPPTVTPYMGAGFNANLGDVVVRSNYVHQMFNGVGSISVVGGSVVGNTFVDNGRAVGFWGGEWGSVVSDNVTIENNYVAYNGQACTSISDSGHGFWLRPSASDGSTFHLRYNCFFDLGVGTCGFARAIRHDGINTVDAELNYWGTTDAGAIATKFGPGAVDWDPYLTGISYTGGTSFVKPTPVVLSASLSASSGFASGGTILFYTNGVLVGTAVTGADGSASFNWGDPPAGSYSVVAKASGGCLTTTATTVNVNTPPVAQCKSLTVSADGTCQANASIDNGSSDPDGDTVTLAQSPAGPYALGDTEVTLTVTDGKGGTSTCKGTVTVVDLTAPVVTCKAATAELDANGNASIMPADVYASGSDNCSSTVTLVSVSPSSFTCADIGDRPVTLTVKDDTGNTATCDATVTVMDKLPPVVTCPAPISTTNDTGLCTASQSFEASSSDNCGVASTVYAIGGTPILSPYAFPVGVTTVDVTVTDVNGNVATCSFTVTVVDTEAPVLVNCPGNKTQVNNLSLAYTPPTATDNCGATVVCSPPSGATLAPGSTNVTCTATDGSGNSDTCSFTVTVTASTTLLYDGVFLDVDGNGSTVLSATLSSPLAGCAVSKLITFTLSQGGSPVATTTGTTDANGKVSVTVPLASGVYDVVVSFAGDPNCTASSDSGVLTVATLGDSAYGGGWYKATASPVTKASFGLVAQKKTDKKTGATYYTGNLVWVHHKKNRLKSTSITSILAITVTGYTKSALVSGKGQLSNWIVDASYLEGGYWSAPVTVDFVATVCDGGTVTVKKTTSDKPDAFGMSIGGSSITLPGETPPIVLSGGSIKVN